MNPSLRKLFEKPIVLLLAVNIIVGLFIFREYGYSWDEPLFYDYGNALGYAYSPREWFSGTFDVDNSYGSSGDDHKTRGPAYLFLSRAPVALLESLGLDQASAWHLLNFLFFQLGVYFLYRLSRRWVSPKGALAASALFAWQPLFWGHAFINPKDPPFLTFFLASVCLGFEMVDELTEGQKPRYSIVVIPALALGITTSIRVLGPLAGLLVFGYFFFMVLKNKDVRGAVNPWLRFFAYGGIAIVAMFLTWPYLWETPITRFFDVFRLMSDNPTTLSVLFNSEIYRAGELPRRYLPFMLATTLTEPVWFLFILGVFTGYWKLLSDGSSQKISKLITATLTLSWFIVLIAYALIRRPAMYDGFRHFQFIIPPIFVFTGFAFDLLLEKLRRFSTANSPWLYAGIIGVLLAPGLLGIARLHPYEYTYYNSFIGGTSGAFRNYETDFWLTCYKEAVEELNEVEEPLTLFVHREAYIADYYADENINVRERRDALDEVQSGDYILVNTRTNEDRRILRDVEPIIQIQRGNAIFCIIKRVP
jgi:hypothetical protein